MLVVKLSIKDSQMRGRLNFCDQSVPSEALQNMVYHPVS